MRCVPVYVDRVSQVERPHFQFIEPVGYLVRPAVRRAARLAEQLRHFADRDGRPMPVAEVARDEQVHHWRRYVVVARHEPVCERLNSLCAVAVEVITTLAADVVVIFCQAVPGT